MCVCGVVYALNCTCTSFLTSQLNLGRAGPLITDATLHALGEHRNLRDLDVSWSSCGDSGVAAVLSGCPSLQLLSVQGCKAVTCDAAPHLVKAPSLVYVDASWVNAIR